MHRALRVDVGDSTSTSAAAACGSDSTAAFGVTPPRAASAGGDGAAQQQWTFDAWRLSTRALTRHAVELLARLRVHEALGVQDDALWQLVHRVRAAYAFDNPYHNWRHAVDVLHTTCALWEHAGAQPTPRDDAMSTHDGVFCAGVALAALAHDAGHPGVTLPVARAVGRSLAPTRYAPASLEAHHSTLAWTCVNGDVCAGTLPLHNLRGQDVRRLRDVMEACILGTNMARHSAHLQHLHAVRDAAAAKQSPLGARYSSEHNIVARWEAVLGTATSPRANAAQMCLTHSDRAASWPSSSVTRDLEDSSARGAPLARGALATWAALVHAADLGAQTRDVEVALRWGDAVMDEFQEQVRTERDHDLPVTRFMVADTLRQRLQCQAGYLRNVALPLWQVTSDVLRLPRVVLDNARANTVAVEELARCAPDDCGAEYSMQDAHAALHHTLPGAG